MSRTPAGTPGAEPPTEDGAVLALLRREIGVRIRPLVAHLPEDQIVALIEQIASITFKYEGVASLRRTPATGVRREQKEESQ
jgi:hypothetical protein